MFNSQSKAEDYRSGQEDSDRWYCASFYSEMEESTCETKQEKKIISKNVDKAQSDLDILVVVDDMRKQVADMNEQITIHKKILEEIGDDNEFIRKIKERLDKKEIEQKSGWRSVNWFCFC